jgi:hypothetical protein
MRHSATWNLNFHPTSSLIHSDSNSLRAIDDTKQLFELFMLDTIERLSEPIDRLFVSRNLDYCNSATVDFLTNKVVFDVHMLYSGVSARWFVKEVDGWLVILIQGDS